MIGGLRSGVRGKRHAGFRAEECGGKPSERGLPGDLRENTLLTVIETSEPGKGRVSWGRDGAGASVRGDDPGRSEVQPRRLTGRMCRSSLESSGRA
jgi:hypothetical protein